MLKRFLSALLTFSFCLFFAGCGQDAPVSSPDSSSIPVEDTSTPVCEDKERIDMLLSGTKADRSLPRKNVAQKCEYTCSRESGGSDGSYTDKAFFLTDGITVDSFNNYSWAGFAGGNSLAVVIDLREKTDNIADFEIGCLRQLDYGIGLPTYAEVSVSDDGTAFSEIGKIFTPTDLQETCKYSYLIKLQEYVSARYIKVKFSKQESGWFFLDEISVYAYGEEDENKVFEVYDYYGENDIPKTEITYFPESDSDYTKKQNLALLASKITVVPFSGFASSYAKLSDNSLDTSILADGKILGFAAWDIDDVFRFSRGEGRSVIFDLGHNCSVEDFGGQAINLMDWGVYPPEEIGISVSADGVIWQGIAMYRFTEAEMNNEGAINFSAKADKAYNARYVKFSFTLRSHSALTELVIIGTKRVSAGTAIPIEGAPGVVAMSDSYYTPEEFDSVDNILCTPICRGDGSVDIEFGLIDADEFMPYVGYYENGTLKDTFFDSFLFSPCGGYTIKEDERTLKGWKYYVDSQFTAERNIQALNTAVGRVKNELSLPDYTANVFMSILRPYGTLDDGSVNAFGDINGDGIDDSLDSLKNRKAAVKWMIDTQLARFAEIDSANLNLVGFYWQEEVFVLEEADELALVKYAADYVHSKGYKLIWIPYYNATGYNRWKETGIDLACLQPNYSFMSIPDDDRLYTAATLAKLYGMSVEIELDSWTNRMNIKRYKEYLEYGVKYGYMNAVKMYYLGVIPTDLTQALAGDEYTASVYKDTYLFAKRRLDSSYKAIEAGEIGKANGGTFAGTMNGIIKGNLDIDDNGSAVIAVSPKYGSLQLNSDGSFVYTPFENFVGADYFEFSVKYIYGTSESAAVDLTVADK